ncbi:MAG: sigma-54 dependent transcriptional regulator [Desulfobacterales bacterium]|nr:sigma-54 dependent transcriptional regulator [Desulfobacterales bacterium]
MRQFSHACLNTVISGESGVGKEVVARNLHEQSPRKDKPFIKINCAALPETLLESELFGYEKGAFTGAANYRRGMFELADHGVLMLDEIGDMPLALQSKLLHVLQNGEFSPLGSEKVVKSDAWVIAASNQELEKRMQQKLFREDLYYRLNTIKIHVSPLRDRPEDIPPLIDYFIDRYNRRAAQNQIIKPEEHLIKKMMAHPWPGNVRELQNVIKRYMVLKDWDEIVDGLSGEKKHADAGPVDNSRFDFNTPEGYHTTGPLKENSLPLKEIRKRVAQKVEREIISYVLSQTAWNRTKAVDILQISYKTLLTKIDELNIKPSGAFGPYDPDDI